MHYKKTTTITEDGAVKALSSWDSQVCIAEETEGTFQSYKL